MSRLISRSLTVLCCLFLFYLWVGFLLVPSLGLSLANQWLQQHSNGPAQLQRLEFNPLQLELRLWQLSIGEGPQLALAAGQARLDHKQLLSGRIQLNQARLQQPLVRIELDENRQLTLSKLFKLPEPQADQPQRSEPFPFSLLQAEIEGGQLYYLDQGTQPAVSNQITQLDVQLDNLHLDQDSPLNLALQAALADGSQLAIQGQFNLLNLQGQGQLQASQLPLDSWWAYVSQQLPLYQQGGLLQLDSQFALQIQPESEPELQISQLQLQLDQLQLRDAKKNLLLQLQQLSLQGGQLDLASRSLQLDSLLANQLNLPLHVDAQGRLNWQALASPQPATTKAASSQPFQLAQLPWHIKAGQISINNSQLGLQLDNQPNPAKLQFDQLALQLSNFDSRSNSPVQASLNTKLASGGQLKLKAQIPPQDLLAQAELSIEQLDLRPAQNWISPYAHVELRSGFAAGTVQAKLERLQPLAFKLDGQVQVQQLHLTENERQKRDLLKWSDLQLNTLSYRHNGHSMRLEIDRVLARKPYARLLIDENLQSNFRKVIIEQPAKPAAAATNPADFSFRIGGIELVDGTADFADFSLRPHFATAVQQLKGQIGSLASDSLQPTTVSISGAVDNHAPVSIKGQLTPFDPLQQLDIETEFKHVELTALTPYSGKFAGYRIQKGRLNLALHYQIKRGQLDASNTVLLEQLQLGEKVDSADAVDLPVRLAVAMLKDTKGNISISLPVSGDLNSPEFSVMPIVWQTLRNLLTRAATSPFRMLAGLSKGKGDLGKVPFAAGSAELNEAARASLDSLASALQQRPQLRLDIEGTSAASFDGLAVASGVLEKRLQELQYSQLQSKGHQLPESAAQLVLSSKQREQLLEQLHSSLLRNGQLSAEAEPPRKERSHWQEQQILHSMASNPLHLRSLAQRRAAAIRDYLVSNAALDVERLYLLDVNAQAKPDNNLLDSLLHLDVL